MRGPKPEKMNLDPGKAESFERMRSVLELVPHERVCFTTDCGMRVLLRLVAKEKLKSLCAGHRSCGQRCRAAHRGNGDRVKAAQVQTGPGDVAQLSAPPAAAAERSNDEEGEICQVIDNISKRFGDVTVVDGVNPGKDIRPKEVYRCSTSSWIRTTNTRFGASSRPRTRIGRLGSTSAACDANASSERSTRSAQGLSPACR
jgi:hypothetical protein